jgi:hypothetical protein
VHRGAARERERGARVELNLIGQTHQRTLRHEDFFGEATVARDAEDFVFDALRFFALLAIFALATE